MPEVYRTLRVTPAGDGVLGVEIDAPPMNLIGPELVRDLVRLLGALESGEEARVMVLESADPEYFVPHVDLTKVAEYTAEAAKAGGPEDASLGMLWHKLSELPVVTIAKIRGRARGAGSELALACDMRFAARENAILGQIEVGCGALPGAGGVQHLARLMGRGRAMEAVLGADDFDAEQAERYGWINRALPDAELDAFVTRLARRIASFPPDAVRSAKRLLNQLTMPGPDAIRADARRFRQLVVSGAAQARTAALFAQGLQTRGPLELHLGDRLGTLTLLVARWRVWDRQAEGQVIRWCPAGGGCMEINMTLHLPRDAASVPVSRQVLDGCLQTLGVTPDTRADIALALSEACANVIQHAGPGEKYEVQVSAKDCRCAIEVVNTSGNNGEPARVGAIAVTSDPVPDYAEHGRGLKIIDAVADNLQLTGSESQGTIVRFEKTLEWLPGAAGKHLINTDNGRADRGSNYGDSW